MNPTIQTATGQVINFLRPDPNAISIVDIGRALSKLCRFTGHCEPFYSVAEHSVWVSRIVPPEYALHGLLHDAQEAYLGDVSTPLKRLLPAYERIEDQFASVIAEAFDLDWTDAAHAAVREADRRMLVTEKRALLPRRDPHGVWSAFEGVESAPIKPLCLLPAAAYWEFAARFRELTK